MLVNKKQLADIIGVTEETITQWQKIPNFPPYKRGVGRTGSTYETADIIAWMEHRQISNLMNENSIDIEEAKRRKIAAEAGLAELELAKEKGEVVLIEQVSTELGEQLSAMRAKLLSLPTKTANLVFTAKDITEAKSILEDAILEALNEMVGNRYSESEANAEAGDRPHDPREAQATA